jgi:hypothetical protein
MIQWKSFDMAFDSSDDGWSLMQSSNLATSLTVLASKISRGLLKYRKWEDWPACVKSQRFPNMPVRRTNPVKIKSVRKNIGFQNTGLKCWIDENFHHWSRHAHRQRIALWVISLVLATQHTYIQSMLNLVRFISFLLVLYKSMRCCTKNQSEKI